MRNYHHLEELAPRDIVSRAIWNEMARTDSEYVYLDMTGIKNVKTRFPNICQACLEKRGRYQPGYGTGFPCSPLYYGRG
jgi:L-aspartate oxidase